MKLSVMVNGPDFGVVRVDTSFGVLFEGIVRPRTFPELVQRPKVLVRILVSRIVLYVR